MALVTSTLLTAWWLIAHWCLQVISHKTPRAGHVGGLRSQGEGGLKSKALDSYKYKQKLETPEKLFLGPPALPPLRKLACRVSASMERAAHPGLVSIFKAVVERSRALGIPSIRVWPSGTHSACL